MRRWDGDEVKETFCSKSIFMFACGMMEEGEFFNAKIEYGNYTSS